jgi:hypothetical protein
MNNLSNLQPEPGEISNQLAGRAESVINFLLPNAKKRGREMHVGSTSGEPGASLKITITGRGAGLWKDFASDEGGDLLHLWQAVRNISFAEALKQARSYLGLGGSNYTCQPSKAVQHVEKVEEKPFALPPIDSGKIHELRELQHQRGLEMFGGMELLRMRGNFGFCHYWGERCWLVYDEPGRVAQVRRLDGKPFANGAKGLTLRGSRASWPVGASNIKGMRIVYICEGATDLLAAATRHAFDRSKPAIVTILGAANSIHAEAVQNFAGCEVRIYADNDSAGISAARRWAQQLKGVAASVAAAIVNLPGADLSDLLGGRGAAA